MWVRYCSNVLRSTGTDQRAKRPCSNIYVQSTLLLKSLLVSRNVSKNDSPETMYSMAYFIAMCSALIFDRSASFVF